MPRKGKKDDFRVKLVLEGEMLKRFNTIKREKREWGLESKSEVIRRLIEQKYQEIQKYYQEINQKDR